MSMSTITLIPAEALGSVKSYLEMQGVIESPTCSYQSNSYKIFKLPPPPSNFTSITIKTKDNNNSKYKINLKNGGGVTVLFNSLQQSTASTYDSSRLQRHFPRLKCNFYLIYFDIFSTKVNIFPRAQEDASSEPFIGTLYAGSGILFSSKDQFSININKFQQVDLAYCKLVLFGAEFVKNRDVTLIYGSLIVSRLLPMKLRGKKDNVTVVNKCMKDKSRPATIDSIKGDIMANQHRFDSDDVKNVFLIPDVVPNTYSLANNMYIPTKTLDNTILNKSILHDDILSLIQMVRDFYPRSQIYIQDYHPDYWPNDPSVVNRYNAVLTEVCERNNCTCINVGKLFEGCTVSKGRVCSKAIENMTCLYMKYITGESTTTSQVQAETTDGKASSSDSLVLKENVNISDVNVDSEDCHTDKDISDDFEDGDSDKNISDDFEDGDTDKNISDDFEGSDTDKNISDDFEDSHTDKKEAAGLYGSYGTTSDVVFNKNESIKDGRGKIIIKAENNAYKMRFSNPYVPMQNARFRSIHPFPPLRRCLLQKAYAPFRFYSIPNIDLGPPPTVSDSVVIETTPLSSTRQEYESTAVDDIKRELASAHDLIDKLQLQPPLDMGDGISQCVHDIPKDTQKQTYSSLSQAAKVIIREKQEKWTKELTACLDEQIDNMMQRQELFMKELEGSDQREESMKRSCQTMAAIPINDIKNRVVARFETDNTMEEILVATLLTSFKRRMTDVSSQLQIAVEEEFELLEQNLKTEPTTSASSSTVDASLQILDAIERIIDDVHGNLKSVKSTFENFFSNSN